MTYISWSSDCLISPRLVGAWVSYFQIMRLCDPNFDLKVNIGQRDLYFMVNVTYISWSSDFAYYLQDYLMDEHHNWYNGSVWRIHWPYQVYVGQWPIFYGPAILLHILTIWWRNVVLGVTDHCDSKIDLVKYMWVSDLYFMVHWFYFVIVRLELFLYIELLLYVKKWHRLGVFVPLQAFAVV